MAYDLIIDGFVSSTLLKYEMEMCKENTENREKKWYNFTWL